MRILTFIFLLATVAQATTPAAITYQGRLTDAIGQPVDTTVDITFRIYGAQSGGTVLWWETHNSVVINDGLFDVVLGSVQPIGNIFDGGTKYLSVQLGTGPESSDRTQLVSVPYAMRANRSDTATYAINSAAGGGWKDDGSVVHLVTSGDSVGIGTTDPQYPLDVRSPGVAMYGRTTGGSFTAGVYGRAENDGFGVMGTSTSGRGVYGASTSGYGGYLLGPKSYVSGNLGIGTENPTHKLTVNGALAIQSAEDTKFHVNYYNSGLNFSETGVADYRMFVKTGGNIGIGTSSPTAKLHVAGDTKINGELTTGTFYSSNITDAPGLASAASGTGLGLTTSFRPYLTREITVPTSGWILALGCTRLWLQHGTTGTTFAEVGLSDDSSSLPTAYRYIPQLSSDVPAGGYGLVAGFNRLFYCPSAGTYTFYMVAREGSDNDVSISNRQLDLIFCTIGYSSKAPEMGLEVEEGKSISEVRAASDARAQMPVTGGSAEIGTAELAGRVDMLTSEIEALKVRLRALEKQ